MATADSRQSVKNTIRQAGLLFQEGPDIGNWKTTRPGALNAEVTAFKNDTVEPEFNRLGIRYYREGEVDPDGYEFSEETWIVEKLDHGEYSWEEEYFTDRDEMVDRVVEIMEEVSANRNGESDS